MINPRLLTSGSKIFFENVTFEVEQFTLHFSYAKHFALSFFHFGMKLRWYLEEYTF